MYERNCKYYLENTQYFKLKIVVRQDFIMIHRDRYVLAISFNVDILYA